MPCAPFCHSFSLISLSVYLTQMIAVPLRMLSVYLCNAVLPCFVSVYLSPLHGQMLSVYLMSFCDLCVSISVPYSGEHGFVSVYSFTFVGNVVNISLTHVRHGCCQYMLPHVTLSVCQYILPSPARTFRACVHRYTAPFARSKKIKLAYSAKIFRTAIDTAGRRM